MPAEPGRHSATRLPRLFLALQALLFIPAGLYLLVDPGLLTAAAGIAASSVSGEIEL